MSHAVTLVIVGVAALVFNHHGAVYRDTYRNREDCERDWPDHKADCEARRGPASGSWIYQGPRYEDGYRPPTADPGARTGTDLVTRSGFGRSGARFGGGS